MQGTLNRECGRIVVLSTADSQPRYHRRVEMFLAAGFAVTVYTFQRGYYRVNAYPYGAEVVALGSVESGRYWSRAPRLGRALRLVKASERSRPRPDLMYCFGFDSTLMAMMVRQRRIPVIYEVGDLRKLHFSTSIPARLFRLCESQVVKRTAGVAATAPALLKDYYEVIHPHCSGRTIVIENMLSEAHFRSVPRPAARIDSGRRRIRIGFVGFLRYPRSLLPLLREVAARPDRFELHVYGDGPLRTDVEEAAQMYENVSYYGPFKNPADLALIYAGLDVNYVVYDNTDRNVRLAIPNKLYESIFFCVPIVVASHTALADRVRELGVGTAIDPRIASATGAWLDELGAGDLSLMSDRAASVPATDLVENSTSSLAELLRIVKSTGTGSCRRWNHD